MYMRTPRTRVSTRIAQNLPRSFDLSILFITPIAWRIRPDVSSTSSVNASSSRPCDLSSSLIVLPMLPSRVIADESTPSSSSCCSITCCCTIDCCSIACSFICDAWSCRECDADEDDDPLSPKSPRRSLASLAALRAARWPSFGEPSSILRSSFTSAVVSATKARRRSSSAGVKLNFDGSRAAMSTVACMSRRSASSSPTAESSCDLVRGSSS